jgi:tetratricopeptide (TPR) repeat protein
MGRVEKTVFISYRRTNFSWAVAIFQDLKHNGYDVFLDYTGIASGAFESVILENIRASAHFLVLLTPSALERCGDPTDLLRREIEAALDSRRNIVPLTVEGFDFGAPAIANQLIGKLALLKQYNALSIAPEFFFEAMEKLRNRRLNVALDAVLHPASLSARQAATEQKGAAAMAPAVAEEELTAEQWFERGVDAHFKRDLDGALRYYDEAVRLKPGYANAFYNRALARFDSRDLRGAMNDYNEAIRLKPDDSYSFNNRGLVRRAQADLDGALADYDEAIRLNSDNAEAFNNRGNARSARGDLEGALQDFDEAIRLQPGKALAFNNRGYARYLQGDLDGAIEDCNEAIRLRPDLAVAFDSRGSARRAKGDMEGALQDYNEAVRLKPDLAAALENRDAVRKELDGRSKI